MQDVVALVRLCRRRLHVLCTYIKAQMNPENPEVIALGTLFFMHFFYIFIFFFLRSNCVSSLLVYLKGYTTFSSPLSQPQNYSLIPITDAERERVVHHPKTDAIFTVHRNCKGPKVNCAPSSPQSLRAAASLLVAPLFSLPTSPPPITIT